MSCSCTAQDNKIDLEKLTFKEDVRALIKTRKKSADRVEPLTSLPAYSVYDTKGFYFGPVAFTGDGYVSFILNSVEDKKLVGLLVIFQNDANSKAVNDYIFKHYGKPEVLQKEVQKKDSKNKPYLSPSAYLWRNVKSGISMLVSNDYMYENGKAVKHTTVAFINNTVKPAYETNFKTVLDRVIKTFTSKE